MSKSTLWVLVAVNLLMAVANFMIEFATPQYVIGFLWMCCAISIARIAMGDENG